MADYPDMICLHQSFDLHCIVYNYTQYIHTHNHADSVMYYSIDNILSSDLYCWSCDCDGDLTVRHAQATHSWRPCMAFAVPERADCKTAEIAVRSQLSPWLEEIRPRQEASAVYIVLR